MRIAFVTDAYIPVPSGVAVSVETLKRALEKLGHTVYVFAPRYKRWNDEDEYVARLPGIFSPFKKYKPLVWPLIKINKKLLKRFELDLVHSHFYFDNFDFARKLAQAAGVAHLTTIYRVFPEHVRKESGFFSLSGSKYKKMVDKMRHFSKGCDRVISLSKPCKKYLVDLGINVPIDVLPVGIYLKDYVSLPSDVIKANFKIPKVRKIVLFVGSVDEESNLRFLLKAFKRVWNAIDDVHLLIVGGSDKLEDFKRIAGQLPYGKYISFTGFLPKKQVNRIYGAADVLAYPTTLDPEPLVILESLAAGTPVVAVPGLGAQDFVKDNEDGLITEPTLDDFADGIIEILRRNKMRLEFSAHARSNAQAFRASNLTSDLLDLYELARKNFQDKIF